MSEPTKELRLKKARDVLWKIDLRGSDNTWLSAQAVIADALAAETAPLHEKIASLEQQLAVLAPPAQTQQGLSEEGLKAWDFVWLAEHRGRLSEPCYGTDGGQSSKWSHTADPHAAKRFATKVEAEAWISTIAPREGFTAVEHGFSRPANPEKQPSPAAAPAQLSEALMKALRAARSALGDEHYVLDNGTHCIGSEQGWDASDCPFCSTDPAALAGQPAPTDDQKALRAAALETHERFREAALPLAQAAYEYREAYAHDEVHDVVERALDKLIKVARRSSRLADFFVNEARALAGSPAQQGQLGKEGAK